MNLQKSSYSLTFECVILLLGNYFSCCLCLSFCNKFRGCSEIKKSTEININSTNKNEFSAIG